MLLRALVSVHCNSLFRLHSCKQIVRFQVCSYARVIDEARVPPRVRPLDGRRLVIPRLGRVSAGASLAGPHGPGVRPEGARVLTVVGRHIVFVFALL